MGFLQRQNQTPRTIILVSARGLVKGACLGVSPLFCGVVWCGIKLVRESGNRLPSVGVGLSMVITRKKSEGR